MPSTDAINVPPGLVKIAETVVFTVPAGHEYDVAALRICNNDDTDPTPSPDAVQHFVSIFRYSGAGPGSDLNVAFKKQMIQQHGTYEFGPFMVPAGGKLTVSGEVDDKMTFTVEGQDKTL